MLFIHLGCIGIVYCFGTDLHNILIIDFGLDFVSHVLIHLAT